MQNAGIAAPDIAPEMQIADQEDCPVVVPRSSEHKEKKPPGSLSNDDQIIERLPEGFFYTLAMGGDPQTCMII